MAIRSNEPPKNMLNSVLIFLLIRASPMLRVANFCHILVIMIFNYNIFPHHLFENLQKNTQMVTTFKGVNYNLILFSSFVTPLL